MLVGLRCKCGKRLKVPESRIGKAGTCPVCRATLRLVAPHPVAVSMGDEALFEITAGPDRVGEAILLAGDGPIEIGRLPGKHIVFGGHSVSRAHCQLVRTETGVWRIEDQRSTSGLYINGQRVDARDLHANDRVRIGDYELSYLCWNSKTTAVAAPDHVTVDSNRGAEAPQDEDLTAAGPSLLDEAFDDDSLYRLSDGDAVEQAQPVTAPAAPAPVTGGPICPSCGQSLAPNARICVQCGIDLKTGRAILTSQDTDLDSVHTHAENVIRPLSWLIPLGIYPVASEAFGIRKPYYIRAIAVITVLISVWFWMYEWSESPRMASAKNYMLWVGSGQPEPGDIFAYYHYTNYGDQEAFDARWDELEAEAERKREQQLRQQKPGGRSSETSEGDSLDEELDDAELANLIVAAHRSLPPDKQY
ncbi:MAG: FHA domain-containing protein, partial [Planctomycetes bacterium]|nr:FHA domain-containing protein [Planctomycetota bacterium]